MKKVFVIMFTLIISFPSIFAGDSHQTRELNRKEEPETGGGGGTGEIFVIVFRGWCGNASIQRVYDHEPSYLETLGPMMEAKQWCDIAYGGPFSILGID